MKDTGNRIKTRYVTFTSCVKVSFGDCLFPLVALKGMEVKPDVLQKKSSDFIRKRIVFVADNVLVWYVELYFTLAVNYRWYCI